MFDLLITHWYPLSENAQLRSVFNSILTWVKCYTNCALPGRGCCSSFTRISLWCTWSVRTWQIGLTERHCKSASVKHRWGHTVDRRTNSWWSVKLASDISSWYAKDTLTWRPRLVVNESRDVGILTMPPKRWPNQEFDWSPHRNMPISL